MKGKGAGVLVALSGSLLLTILGVRTLSQFDWDPTVYASFGKGAHETTAYAEQRLGDVYLRPEAGHDGKFFFVQATDPWVMNPAETRAVLDRPLYRSQRMMYPLIASGLGLFGPETIVWTLIIVNILALGAGSFAASEVAGAMGMSPWWGLAFAFNPGFISEFNIDGAGIVAAAAAFGAVALALRGRHWWGVGLMVVAVLSREAMLIAAVGSALWVWRHKGSQIQGLQMLLMPGVAIGLWAIYLRIRFGWETGTSEVWEIGVPFGGFADAFAGWLAEPSLSLAVGLAMMALFVVFTFRAIRSAQLVGWGFVGFVALGVLFTERVWSSYFDITRAVAPVLTAYILLLFSASKPTEPVLLAEAISDVS